MYSQIITVPKQKAWGVTDHGDHPGHFFTGYVWSHGETADSMEPGRNVIIDGDFCFDGMVRGQSKANFYGHFRDHPDVRYIFAMSGMLELVELIQEGKLTPVDGHLSGRWTFAKQGENIFLKPYTGA